LGRTIQWNWRASKELDSIVRLWLLRIVVELGADGGLFDADSIGDAHLAGLLGLKVSRKHHDRATARQQLRSLLAACENDQAAQELPPILDENIERLAALVGLSEIDRQILGFAVLLSMTAELADACRDLGEMTSTVAMRAVSAILHLSTDQVFKALGPAGLLARAGLLSVNKERHADLAHKLQFGSIRFPDWMTSEGTDPLDLIADAVVLARPAELGLDDYPHLTDSLQILIPYLRRVVQDRREGVNVLIHGLPGTGKTQLARTLAREVGVELFEITDNYRDGEPMEGSGRLTALHAAQHVLAQRRVLLVFDELEDAFAGTIAERSAAQSTKAWINRTLEQNPLPTIWVSNSTACLDPAFVRRFDFCLELPVPPKPQRERMIRAACGELVDDAAVARLASGDMVAPAVIARAAAVVGAVQGDGGDAGSSAAIELLVRNTMLAQGHRVPNDAIPDPKEQVYDLECVNADGDLRGLAENLRRVGAGRIFLHGAPGTGKTAYARWLADTVGKPLRVKRASDILSPFVGQNEQNIASAFRAAKRDGAVLLIDEIDTFLLDRRNAQRHWEVSLVNEMLTQMECYDGIFIASTNQVGALDKAALRRFDIKIGFGTLRPEQAWELLRRQCVALGLGEPEQELQRTIQRLDGLVVGDFATVARRSRLSAIGTASAFVAALAEECALRGKRTIGFALP
jgi:AAA+ superfamily predicted ATPase